jgi:hypothetical protein
MHFLTTRYNILHLPFLHLQAKENTAFSLPVFTPLTPYRDYAWLPR